MSGVDIAGLVEELRAAPGFPHSAQDYFNLVRRAADALLAQAAELVEARGEIDRVTSDRQYIIGWNDGFAHVHGPLRFPTMLRKMWSGGEVQAWLDKQRIEAARQAAADEGSEEREAGLAAWKEEAESVFRGLSSFLGMGGDGADVEPAAFDRRIREGIEQTQAPLLEAWRRYLKLRSIGAAPNGTLHLTKGLVMVATNLDKWLDEYLEKGLPPARSHAVEFGAKSVLENGSAPLADATNNPPSDPGTEQREAGV